ncbi:uncharacterized protein N7484_005360 [Penicillium longicatenatum]|uniref:uncharacterized protein n=1 Tax=Penicillium longicatenatum TaxID=1561947 RepID=UPI0025495A95|nr:uncharacterized protein N7484_005360 [Penicillium longicatenatum]KAJ5642853.1 hypothetical protein N7484_005360 [Penicillium longicatenatum]
MTIHQQFRADSALPQGSLILVTGASGFLASHIITEALHLGFCVRGVVRSKDKGKQTEALFNSPKYSSVVVQDMAADKPFDGVLHDVDGIIHCASVTTFSPDAESVIPPTITGTLNILHAAIRQSNVVRFVYTSSATAVTFPCNNLNGIITAAAWNHEAVNMAQQAAADSPDMPFLVYSASKMQAEQAVWRFTREEKPHFTVNCVLPATSFGRILGPAGESGKYIPDLVLRRAVSTHLPPQYIVDVKDSARIHLAALLDVTVANERVLAFGHSINWNDIIDSIQQSRPELQLPTRIPGLGRDLREVENSLAVNLLKKWWDKDAFTELDETVRENLVGVNG